MKIMYIMRGIPGAGKSTIAAKLVGEKNVFAADDYFYHNGEYCFDPEKLKDAHKYCQTNVEKAMKNNTIEIAVANTNIKQWEMEVYKKLAKNYKYHVVELTVKSDFENMHDVPSEVVNRMKNDFEY